MIYIFHHEGEKKKKMKKIKILWASRHTLDPDAEQALRKVASEEIEKLEELKEEVEILIARREILWSSDEQECSNLAQILVREFSICAGVWPAQAVEAFHNIKKNEGRDYTLIIGPVSVPETEPDMKKTRPFRFVRWAFVA